MQLKLISPLERELKRLNFKLEIDSWKVLRKYFKLYLEDGGKQPEKMQHNNKGRGGFNKKDL